MICEKCKHIVCASAFSIGVCNMCGCDTITPHIPSYKVCKKCSVKYGLCEQCGKQAVKE
jgi:hypothetical protein